MDKFFVIRNKILWGDYGSILISGMGHGDYKFDGAQYCISRTGPFAPPVSLSENRIIVTEKVKNMLLRCKLKGSFKYRSVTKEKIVDLKWDDWDFNADEPQKYPIEGEPENYILLGSHSQHASDLMGPLWELFLPNTSLVEKNRGGAAWETIHSLSMENWAGDDLFGSSNSIFRYASESGRKWLLRNGGDWLDFEEIEVTE